MGVIRKRIFYHHADTCAIGGHFLSPIHAIIPIQAPLSLAASGGFGTAHSGKFSFHEMISFEEASTTVSGSFDREKKSWTTVATSTIEGLNILDVVTIDRVVAHIISEHPEAADEYEPTISLVGSAFEGVKISGSKIDIDVDYDLLKHEPDQPSSTQGNENKTQRRPLIESEHFLNKVELQYKQTVDHYRQAAGRSAASSSGGEQETRGWIEDRYSADGLRAKINRRGVVLSSLVKEIRGQSPAFRYGHILEVPELGRLFLGEVLVDHNTHRLIMVRAELGSPATGDASAGQVALEGRAWP